MTYNPNAGPSGWTVISKSADESKTNDNTLADDSQLKFNMSANAKYRIRGVIFFSQANANPDIKVAVQGPAAPTLVVFERTSGIFAGTPALQAILSSYLGSTSITSANPGDGMLAFDMIVHNGANAGTFAFQWAQNTADAVNATTVRAGSYIQYSQV